MQLFRNVWIYQVKLRLLSSTKTIGLASRFAERLKTENLRKSRNIWEMSVLTEDRA